MLMKNLNKIKNYMKLTYMFDNAIQDERYEDATKIRNRIEKIKPNCTLTQIQKMESLIETICTKTVEERFGPDYKYLKSLKYPMEKLINSTDIKVGMLMKWSGHFYDDQPKCIEELSEIFTSDYLLRENVVFLEGENVVIDVNNNHIILDNNRIFIINEHIEYVIIEEIQKYNVMNIRKIKKMIKKLDDVKSKKIALSSLKMINQWSKIDHPNSKSNMKILQGNFWYKGKFN